MAGFGKPSLENVEKKSFLHRLGEAIGIIKDEATQRGQYTGVVQNSLDYMQNFYHDMQYVCTMRENLLASIADPSIREEIALFAQQATKAMEDKRQQIYDYLYDKDDDGRINFNSPKMLTNGQTEIINKMFTALNDYGDTVEKSLNEFMKSAKDNDAIKVLHFNTVGSRHIKGALEILESKMGVTFADGTHKRGFLEIEYMNVGKNGTYEIASNAPTKMQLSTFISKDAKSLEEVMSKSRKGLGFLYLECQKVADLGERGTEEMKEAIRSVENWKTGLAPKSEGDLKELALALSEATDRAQELYGVNVPLTASALRECVLEQNKEIGAICAEAIQKDTYTAYELPMENGVRNMVMIDREADGNAPKIMFCQIDKDGDMIPKTFMSFETEGNAEIFLRESLGRSMEEFTLSQLSADSIIQNIEELSHFTMPLSCVQRTIEDAENTLMKNALSVDGYMTAHQELLSELEKTVKEKSDVSGILQGENKETYNKIFMDLTSSATSFVKMDNSTYYTDVKLTERSENGNKKYDVAMKTNYGDKLMVSYDENGSVEGIYVQKEDTEKHGIKDRLSSLLNSIRHKEPNPRDMMVKVFDKDEGVTQNGFDTMNKDGHLKELLENFTTMIKANDEFERNNIEKEER